MCDQVQKNRHLQKNFPNTDTDKGMHVTKVWKKKIGDKKNS